MANPQQILLQSLSWLASKLPKSLHRANRQQIRDHSAARALIIHSVDLVRPVVHVGRDARYTGIRKIPRHGIIYRRLFKETAVYRSVWRYWLSIDDVTKDQCTPGTTVCDSTWSSTFPDSEYLYIVVGAGRPVKTVMLAPCMVIKCVGLFYWVSSCDATVSGCLANLLITRFHWAAATGTDDIELGNFVKKTFRIGYSYNTRQEA